MRRTASVAGAAGLIVAASAALVLALGGDHPRDLPFHGGPDFPKALRDLVNSPGRVDGYFINAANFFYYHGDTEAFNRFIERYAKLEGIRPRLVLHAGRGMTSRPWQDHTPRAAEWRLRTSPADWLPESHPDYSKEKGRYSAVVELWLGGDVALDGIDVPLKVQVLSGGEIEKFVAQHEAKQSLVKP